MSDPRAVAIVHYHLRPGGVSRIVEHAAAALRDAGVRAAVLIGHDPPGSDDFPAPVRLVEGLGYEDDRGPSVSPDDLAERLRNAAAGALGGEPDLWHVHNHALGKNFALPGALRRLAEDGRRLLLQPHDFAEDGRPLNYRRLVRRAGGGDPVAPGLDRVLYPLADHVHYATLNSRDRRHLTAAGIGEDHVHILPNAIELAAPADASPPPASERRLFLYPTRAIRRKNIGELLLWSALGEAGDRYATTLGPQNPEHRPVYLRWVAFAGELGLPVDFEIGSFADASFTALLRSAHAIVTTSVAEGFGLAFLEPWVAGRPLLGRDLPDITGDFVREGIDLSALYDRLEAPVAWVGEDELRRRIAAALRKTYEAYGRSCEAGHVDRAMSAAVWDGRVDFARLDEPFQRRIVERIVRSDEARAQITPPRLARGGLPDARVIAANRRLVRDCFGIAHYGRRLLRVYRAVCESPVGPVEAAPAGRVLDQFLQPERFLLLRS